MNTILDFIKTYEVEAMDIALALWAYDPHDERLEIVRFRPGPLLSPGDIIEDENEEYFYAQYLYSLIRESKEEFEKLWDILIEMMGEEKK